MGFEDELQRHMFSMKKENTFIDKLLAKDDIEAVRVLMKKQNLTRSDLLDLLYMLSSAETKLFNFSQWERYVINKFFVWIREAVKIAELLYDYKDFLQKKAMVHKEFELSPQSKKLFSNAQNLIEHNIKFLVDLYFNLGRTSLSLGASGFMELLKNKFEVDYRNAVTHKSIEESKKPMIMIRRHE